jgi:hypothetical protein
MINPTESRRGRIGAHTITVPVVDPAITLESALSSLRRARKKALLIRAADGFQIHTYDSIRDAREKGSASSICDLTGHGVHIVDLPPGMGVTRKITDHLTRSGKGFALLSAPDQSAQTALVYYLRNYKEPDPDDE